VYCGCIGDIAHHVMDDAAHNVIVIVAIGWHLIQDEGSKRSSMAWQASEGKPYHALTVGPNERGLEVRVDEVATNNLLSSTKSYNARAI